jgi:pSer/pThr/pTyr-binding forkhead associated (FHA) protein
VLVEDALVGYVHAEILGDGDEFTLRSYGPNGTFVNGRVLRAEDGSVVAAEHKLQDMDRIELAGANKPVYFIFRAPQAGE